MAAAAGDTRAPGSAGDCFPQTRWTAVVRAGGPDSAGAQRALEELCRSYWYPLYSYVRRQGTSKEDAEDLTQGFFEDLLARDDFSGLSAENGRFRAFLLAAFKHFVAKARARAQRQKRGGGAVHLSLDMESADSRYRLEAAAQSTPEVMFDRAWGVAVLEQALIRLEDEMTAARRGNQLAELKPFLMSGRREVRYAEPAERLGMTEGALRVAVHRLRRRFRDMVRGEIGQTLADPSQADDEIRALFGAFAG